MKRQTLLLLVMISFITALQAQKNKKQQPLNGYAVTAAEKGGKSWREVRMVNMTTGEELKSIYQSKQEVEALNARTGKPVVKKDVAVENNMRRVSVTTLTPAPSQKKVVNLDQELEVAQGRRTQTVRTVVYASPAMMQTDKPFSTNSAAMAYDKKHDRLYYTPMGINQLRYIDLKSEKIYYFENESFGTVKGLGDAANQITRMAMGSDGNGYALTNDGMHLIRFTTDKNPTITDLGGLTDDAGNGTNSFRNRGGFGGDMIADAAENLYLITANRNVYKISIETKVAKHLGAIKGLPQGFSTNGAMVEEGSKVIVASSESTVGYYRFDLETLQAEKVSESPDVFNASDLANGNLAFDGKKKKKKQPAEEIVAEEPKETVTDVAAKQKPQEEVVRNNGIAIFPNPAVTGESIKLSFADQPTGRYQVQLLDLSGRLIRAQEVNIASKSQIVNFSLPEVSKGNYLIKVFNDQNKVSATSQIVVQ